MFRWFGPSSSAICALALAVSLTACARKSQDAVVTGKEYVPAQTGTTAIADNQLDHEQWIVEVEMANRLKGSVPVEHARWESLKMGDKVKVSYSQGKYTGTIWGIEIQ